jgi:hypothetical protein
MEASAAWAEMLGFAREFDESGPHNYWSLPMEPLIAAAAGTSLRRFFPYMSMAWLRFGMVYRHWAEFQPQPPVFIAGHPDYIVYWGQMASEVEQETVLLETRSPAEAAELAALLLRDWPYQYPARPRHAPRSRQDQVYCTDLGTRSVQ